MLHVYPSRYANPMIFSDKELIYCSLGGYHGKGQEERVVWGEEKRLEIAVGCKECEEG